ncbi:MAG: peptidylprolyl isomerase, partial [Saprospiraceae bacterium]|nr:peptidylprolyl isomerase [Saprospiraceae bacterium]
MKRILYFLLAALISTGLQAQKKIIDKVIGTVGNEIILLSEVEEQRAMAQAQQGQVPPNIRCDILDNLLINNLLLNQARLDSIEVTDAEVEEQLNARIERILGYMNNDVRQFEDYYGQSINEVKDQFRGDLRSQIMIERMRGKILASVKVTPAEVKEFFNKIPQDSLPYFSSEVEIGEIVRKPQVSEAERKRSIELLEDLRARILEEDEDFVTLAARYSDDPSARSGGDLGWTKRGDFVPEFEAAAYKLERNELSPVIETEFGFHLIQMLERRGNRIRVRHILIRPRITEDDIQQAKEYLDSVRQVILTDTTLTFSRAVKRFSNEDVQSYNNDGRMVNSLTGNTFFEIGDLEPDIYFTI